MSRRLLFVVNEPDFFLSHRLPLALEARREGYDVQVATGPGKSVARIRSLGFAHHALALSRSGKNPLIEIASLIGLCRVFHKARPDLVHLVTIKPVLYGGIAARLVGVRGVVAAISGLGFVFTGHDWKTIVLRSVVKMLYRLALCHKNMRVIFQNPADRAVLVGLGLVSADKTVTIRGSGVDLDDYIATPEPDGVPVVVMASRLLKDKGVVEFIEAASQLRKQQVRVRFLLAGEPDPGNPASVGTEKLDAWRKAGDVELLGFRRDIAALFATSHIVVLPSYYREGLPKVLAEAAACGRAVVTTNMPGCRDAIEPGVTGLLVRARDATALAQTILQLIEDGELRRQMGRAGRELAEREFSIGKIVAAHLTVYRSVLGGA